MSKKNLLKTIELVLAKHAKNQVNLASEAARREIATDDAGTDASSAHKSSTENDGSVWVCHNPDSEWHGHICNEECYWVGFERSENSYCWLLRRKDCQEPLELEWQRENCHLLKEEHDCD